MPRGIAAGQAWECEAEVDLADYQQDKTGALFAAATVAGAAAAGAEAEPWRLLGERLGEAYQVADDIRDVACDAEELGKPIGQDQAHARPSAVAPARHATARCGCSRSWPAGAVASIPACPGAAELRAHILSEAHRLVPKQLAAARGLRATGPAPAGRHAGSDARDETAPHVVGPLSSAWVDRLFASPRFQRWAAAFPLTRPIARRRARGLFDLVAGFVYSQVLFAARAAAPVRHAARRAADRWPSSPRASACRKPARPGCWTRRWRCGWPSAAAAAATGWARSARAMVGNPGIAAMIEHHALLYADLRDPVALLRGERGPTALGGYWPYAGADGPAALTPAQVAGYTALMAASQPLHRRRGARRLRCRRHRCLLDVGGGDGRFLAAAAARAPACG